MELLKNIPSSSIPHPQIINLMLLCYKVEYNKLMKIVLDVVSVIVILFILEVAFGWWLGGKKAKRANRNIKAIFDDIEEKKTSNKN